jgi:suppressor of ftsI
MGRFRNVLLIDGEPDYRLEVHRGEVVRFHLTNASNTRTFNPSVGERLAIKLVATDLGRFEREEWIESIVVALAERYVTELRFDQADDRALVSDVQALDHVRGRFERQVDMLGMVSVGPSEASPDLEASDEDLRHNHHVTRDINAFRHHLKAPPNHRLSQSLRTGGLPLPMLNFLQVDTNFFPPVEWNDGMPMMNWVSTGRNLRRVLWDLDSGLEDMKIDWSFELGEVIRLRILNDPRTLHPMHHPLHIDGQRFLVYAVDGILRSDLAWKGTVIIPTGSTVDLLVEMWNPGRWMLHCHILEHAGSDMMMVFDAKEASHGLPASDSTSPLSREPAPGW